MIIPRLIESKRSIRFCVHIFNSLDDIYRIIDELCKIHKKFQIENES